MSTENNETKSLYAEFVMNHYERTHSFTDDIVTTEDIQELAVQAGIVWQSIGSINLMLVEMGIESRSIKNTPERVWMLRGK